ncbi:hypothetical protein ABZ695_26970 [Streptomyces sp. NPDC006976]|uniref:hypothetical protein n=1 Tax=Streptomyces sp. NPDC006976 TaxID=3154311 RepID=UPI0033C117E4
MSSWPYALVLILLAAAATIATRLAHRTGTLTVVPMTVAQDDDPHALDDALGTRTL